MKTNNFIKYPRTPHLPWSEGCTSDDKMLKDVFHFIGKQVVITEKMDGENTTLYQDGFHARSLDSRHHPSRDWLADFHSKLAYEIPKGWRVCGENLFAKHSIEYQSLDSYFLGFSIWNEDNEALSWELTLDWFEMVLGITPVPVLFEGTFDEVIIKQLSLDLNKSEGYVIRNVDSFEFKDFSKSVAKFVRKNHVTTEDHWMHTTIIKNGLK